MKFSLFSLGMFFFLGTAYADIEDLKSAERQADGTYLVTCEDGRQETVKEADYDAGRFCKKQKSKEEDEKTTEYSKSKLDTIPAGTEIEVLRDIYVHPDSWVILKIREKKIIQQNVHGTFQLNGINKWEPRFCGIVLNTRSNHERIIPKGLKFKVTPDSNSYKETISFNKTYRMEKYKRLHLNVGSKDIRMVFCTTTLFDSSDAITDSDKPDFGDFYQFFEKDLKIHYEPKPQNIE